MDLPKKGPLPSRQRSGSKYCSELRGRRELYSCAKQIRANPTRELELPGLIDRNARSPSRFFPLVGHIRAVRGTLRAWSLRIMLRHSARPPIARRWRMSASLWMARLSQLPCTPTVHASSRASFAWSHRSPRVAAILGERVCKDPSVHRARSASATEPVLQPNWRHRTAKLARRGRAQGPAGPSDERARRDRREPLAPLARRDPPARKATRVRPRSFASSPERRR